MASIVSAVLLVATTARGAGRDTGAAAGDVARGADATAVAATGAEAATGAPVADAEAAELTVAGAGILMVGAAVGFGGRLMRTVSFFCA